MDGFVSLHAPPSGGEMITKPIRFTGRNLELNFSASAAGSVRVELLHGQVDLAIEGYALDDCIQLLGDDLDRTVRWTQGADVSAFSGELVRLRFSLQDADIYSFRFVE